MNREQILATISNLAKSQGYYQRLLNILKNLKETNSAEYDKITSMLERKEFKDEVELVMYLES